MPAPDPTPETVPEPQPELHDVIPAPPVPIYAHKWRQRGHTVHCDSCEHPHGFTVDPAHQLIGVDANGAPVLGPVNVSQATHIDGKKVARP